MNKTVITMALSALCYTFSASSMTIDQLLSIQDITPQIIKNIARQDFPDMRLVCKKWAQRGIDGKVKENWQFMPNSVEKHYDKIIKQKNKFRSIYKTIILFDLINDSNAVTWIINRNPTKTEIQLSNKCLTSPCTLSAAMLAIYYQQPATARLLIEANKRYKNQHWKDVYKTMTIPTQIEECLSPGYNRDFSFIPYLTAAWFDNAQNLKKLYKNKMPTILGQTLIIDSCLNDNAQNCFNFLLTYKTTKKTTKIIINKNPYHFFQITIDCNKPELAKKLIAKKLFNLNVDVNNKMTILDFYLQDEHYKNNKKAHALLRSLGAKTWQELHPPIPRGSSYGNR